VQPRFLILETSHRVGKVALALEGAIVGESTLDEARRHGRDLVPAVKELLAQQGWRARDLCGVIVSRGPGSYTGLRVGLISAKTLAFATGAALLAIDTFEAIASQTPATFQNVDVIADAQQDKVYVQRFGPHREPLTVLPFSMWIESALARQTGVMGPGLETFAKRLPNELTVLPPETWLAAPASLLQIGWRRFQDGERDDPFAVEPLYLRASEAERKWERLHPPAIR
jgi:tRNA threonylcarbamoyladenosine biosynthesis protein TsaB